MKFSPRDALVVTLTLGAGLLAGYLEHSRRSYLSRLPTDEAHVHQVLQNIWTPDQLKRIRAGLEKLGEEDGIPNGDQYGYGRWPLTEHVGEAEPLGADGRCANRYLVPTRTARAASCTTAWTSGCTTSSPAGAPR